MFTADQIKQAHSKVKSGADFPAYIQDLIKLGVAHYETFVSDGHADFYGENDVMVSLPAKYDTLNVADTSDANQFKADLVAHQQGKTDYPKFCIDAAKSGINKWDVSLFKMTCTYYNKDGAEILTEVIPQ